MAARMIKRREGQQGWRWVHGAAGLQRDARMRNRMYWLVLIALGIGLNVGVTVLANV